MSCSFLWIWHVAIEQQGAWSSYSSSGNDCYGLLLKWTCSPCDLCWFLLVVFALFMVCWIQLFLSSIFYIVHWKPYHVIMVFTSNDYTRHKLARQSNAMIESFSFTSNILCYVKDEGINLENMTMALKSVILCESLSFLAPFDGACFEYVMSKGVQYASNDNKVSKDLTLVNVKFA